MPGDTSNWIIFGIFGLLLLLVAGFTLLLFFTALFEKMPVRQFEFLSDGHEPNNLPHAAKSNEAAQHLGLHCGGTFRQNRGGMYQGLQTLWLTGDGSTLISVGGGTILRMPYKALRLRTLLPGRIIETVNESGVYDLSGMIDRESLLDADFHHLYARHQDRIRPLRPQVQFFDIGHALEQQEGLQLATYERMVELGYMRCVDTTGQTFRYTWRGALRVATVGFFSDLKKGIDAGKAKRK